MMDCQLLKLLFRKICDHLRCWTDICVGGYKQKYFGQFYNRDVIETLEKCLLVSVLYIKTITLNFDCHFF